MGFPVQSAPQNAATLNQSTDVTPSSPILGFLVLSAGDIKVDMVGVGTAVVHPNIQPGLYPCACKKIYSTANGTTATIALILW